MRIDIGHTRHIGGVISYVFLLLYMLLSRSKLHRTIYAFSIFCPIASLPRRPTAKAAEAGGMARHVSCEVTEAAEAGGMAVAWW